jgi:ribonuclease PH
MTRADGRENDQLRPISFEAGIQSGPAGSVLVSYGGTRVICAANVEDRTPRWKSSGGWLTAEYAMLPGAGVERTRRDRNGPGGRAKEIERLIGRSLRVAVDLDGLGERTFTIDCDVLEADGGTRTASITGGWVALQLAFRNLGITGADRHQVVAVSVGIVDGEARLDLPYEEDVRAEVDANVVMTGDGRVVEIQGTAEGEPFDRKQLDELIDLAHDACIELASLQRAAVDGA